MKILNPLLLIGCLWVATGTITAQQAARSTESSFALQINASLLYPRFSNDEPSIEPRGGYGIDLELQRRVVLNDHLAARGGLGIGVMSLNQTSTIDRDACFNATTPCTTLPPVNDLEVNLYYLNIPLNLEYKFNTAAANGTYLNLNYTPRFSLGSVPRADFGPDGDYETATVTHQVGLQLGYRREPVSTNTYYFELGPLISLNDVNKTLPDDGAEGPNLYRPAKLVGAQLRFGVEF